MNKMPDDFPMTVVVEEDDSMTISWDPDHPATSVFNTWSEEDFINAIAARCKEVLAEHGE
jgi:hypothetical protein